MCAYAVQRVIIYKISLYNNVWRICRYSLNKTCAHIHGCVIQSMAIGATDFHCGYTTCLNHMLGLIYFYLKGQVCRDNIIHTGERVKKLHFQYFHNGLKICDVQITRWKTSIFMLHRIFGMPYHSRIIADSMSQTFCDCIGLLIIMIHLFFEREVPIVNKTHPQIFLFEDS